MKDIIHKSSLWMTMLTSGSTLICCALPAILVALGAGTAVVVLVGAFPQLIWLSAHKIGLFGFGAVMLAVSRYFSRITQNTCPMDPQLAQKCKEAKRLSGIIWWGSVVLYIIGFSVSYILPFLLG